MLLRSADIALYQAKSDGRNRFRYFEPGMDSLMQARREPSSIFVRRSSPRSSSCSFSRVNLENECITGFEALLRWHSPQRGIVAPDDFITVAEEIGGIIQIGE